MIAARAVLGLAGAALAPSTLSLIRNMFQDPADRTVAVGVWIASFSAGTAIGPLVGGLLLERFWWGSVFLVGTPVMILLLFAAPVLLPEAFPGAGVRRGARDLSLAAFVGIGIFVFTSLYLQWVVGLSPLRAGLWTSPMALALLAGSLLTPAIARRVRPALVIAASLLLAAIGFALLGRLGGRVEPRPLRRR